MYESITVCRSLQPHSNSCAWGQGADGERHIAQLLYTSIGGGEERQKGGGKGKGGVQRNRGSRERTFSIIEIPSLQSLLPLIFFMDFSFSFPFRGGILLLFFKSRGES